LCRQWVRAPSALKTFFYQSISFYQGGSSYAVSGFGRQAPSKHFFIKAFLFIRAFLLMPPVGSGAKRPQNIFLSKHFFLSGRFF